MEHIYSKEKFHEFCLTMRETLSKISAELAWPGHSTGALGGMLYALDRNIIGVTQCIESTENAAAVVDPNGTSRSVLEEASDELMRLREKLILKREQAQEMNGKDGMKDRIIDAYSNVIERVRRLHSLVYDLRRHLEQ